MPIFSLSSLLQILRASGQPTGEQNRLRSIHRTQFAQDDGHVRLDRRLRDLKIFADLLVEPSFAQHAKDSKLLRCQMRYPLRDLKRSVVCAGLSLGSQSGRRHDLSAKDGLNAVTNGGRVGGFRHEALRPECQCPAYGARIVGRRNHDDGQLGA